MNQQYVRDLSVELIQEYHERNKVYDDIDRMIHVDYDLPVELRELAGVHKVVSTDPFDAIRAATRVLTSDTPRFRYQPLWNDEVNRQRANEIEQILTWWFTNANKRSNATVLRDTVQSALRYDEICLQTIYLPYQRKNLKALGLDSAQMKHAKLLGDFAVNVYNPRYVYPMHGAYGLEHVLTARVLPLHRVISQWGDAATKDLQGATAETDKDGRKIFNWVTLFDYWDMEEHYVWAVPGEQNVRSSPNVTSGVDILKLQKHDLDFIPWICVVGGSSLEDFGENARTPLLYPVRQSKQWQTQNILETIVMTKVIANAAKAQTRVTGPTLDQGMEQNYDVLGGQERLLSGYEATDLPPQTLDAAMLTQADRIAGRMNKSTVSAILQSGDLPSGTAYAALNLATQTAVGSIKPYKELAELAIAETLKQFLLWVKHGGEIVTAYGTGRETMGAQYQIDPMEIQEDAIYIDVELVPDVPTDRLQRVNGAILAVQSLSYPLGRALEDIGVTDPEQAIRRSYMEKIKRAVVESEIMKIQARAQAEMDMMNMQLQQQMAQQQAAEAQAQQPQETPPPQPTSDAYGLQQIQESQAPPGIPLGKGTGFDANRGGIPPALLNPNATREGQTLEDRSGAPTGVGL